MDDYKNNYNNQDEEHDIFRNEDQFRAYAPNYNQDGSSQSMNNQTANNQWIDSQNRTIGLESTENNTESMDNSSSNSGYGYYSDYYGSSDGSYAGGNRGNNTQQNSWQQTWQQPTPPQPKQRKKHHAGRWIAAVMASVLLVGAAAGGGVYVGARLAAVEVSQETNTSNTLQEDNHVELTVGSQSSQETIDSTDTVNGVENTAFTSDLSPIVENAMPSIVAINCTSEYDMYSFWGQQYTQEAQGSGSGIIIGQNKEEVLIVTNNHVVATQQNAKNETIEVVFCDETSAPATIKGTEEGSDLAVVSVKLSDLEDGTLRNIKIATLGDSDSLKVGQMAIAIGNALGYGQSTTVGWISAVDREVMTEDYTMSLIQTDAAINPGNSGGALLNVKGEVIGINSAKYSDESVEGMGFAIPISDAIPIINDLMNREEIPEEEQAYLGIVGQDVTESYNKRYGMPVGVYVYQVSQGSPAEQAGLKMGDIITGFNGKTISSMTELQNTLAIYRGGTEITLTIQVFENGEYTENTLHVTLGYKNQ